MHTAASSDFLPSNDIQLLRQFPNPFAEFVRPQYDEDSFEEINVPEINADARERILRCIECYRVQSYKGFGSLPPARAIRVLGPRGAGKTHLLQAVLHRPDKKPQLIVSRKVERFRETIPFEEYLLQMLIDGLVTPQAPSGVKYFDAIAAQLTRNLLFQTVQALAPHERLFARPLSRWTFFRTLWLGGAEKMARQLDNLASELEGARDAEQLRALDAREEATGLHLFDLTMANLQRCEEGSTTLSIMRRELYQAMVRATLRKQGDALNDFLESDYQPNPARPVSREELVRCMLITLIEACTLVQLPVVFAFDNMEGMLLKSGNLVAERAAAFFGDMAQVMDHFRGILVLLFFEQTLWAQTWAHVDDFARNRLDQVVHCPGYAGVSEIMLHSPGESEIRRLVLNRMQSIRQHLPNGESQPEEFPFQNTTLRQIASVDTNPVRGKIRNLHEIYDQIVFGVKPVIPNGNGTLVKDWSGFLSRVWKDKLGEANRALEGSLPGNSQALTKALGELLELSTDKGLAPWLPKGCKVHRVQALISSGEDPRYGWVSVLELARAGNGESHRVAIGFLLANTRGMVIDLKGKLSALVGDVRADELVIIWPNARSPENLAQQLTGQTAAAWQESGAGPKTTWATMDHSQLRKVFAVPNWREQVCQEISSDDSNLLREFVINQCSTVLAVVEKALRRNS